MPEQIVFPLRPAFIRNIFVELWHTFSILKHELIEWQAERESYCFDCRISKSSLEIS
jgi:hypothetical protein